MSYQQKGCKAIRLSQINQPILKARKSQDYPTEYSLDHKSRNSSLKQNRAITQHNSRLIREEEFVKMRRPQTSKGSRRKKLMGDHAFQGTQNSNTKCEILECENEDDKDDQQQQHIYLINCNPSNTARNNQNKVPFQTTLDQDFLGLFANDQLID
ncbi:unnamed protein product (macronuclear) [Paramecium tetraurelia]|uniref:Uncharacterized protein n=1 Tax=Paramecium tetraurelia TaxID=5888 RepID=A0BWY9_PARTE|nr:uncharacterized protein GSPATT00032908001 [Paramecium tetraurelia]CAK63056.1 unnamed protein product [Paramecium tetraurelia]|eukprot:XP_001430454.1 hypothetical protein (macronuclear) [Paramecium tetraurelia strain d4-2]